MIPHIQSTSFTTAASALLTVLHHFNPEIPKTKEKEFDIWHQTATLPTRASSIYALANYAHQHKLKPKIVVGTQNYSFPDYRFYRYTKEDVHHAEFSEDKHRKAAITNNIPITERTITLNEIKELSKNNILLLRLNVKPIRNEKRNTSNYIIIHGYNNNYFHLVDPALGGLSVPENVMKDAFDSLRTKKYRDHRMILFSTPNQQ